MKEYFIILVFLGLSCGQKPNIVMFLTDDLDSTLGGMIPLTKTRKWIEDEVMNCFNNVVKMNFSSKNKLVT